MPVHDRSRLAHTQTLNAIQGLAQPTKSTGQSSQLPVVPQAVALLVPVGQMTRSYSHTTVAKTPEIHFHKSKCSLGVGPGSG